MEVKLTTKSGAHTNICFDCQNAVGGCEWSRAFDPVPGWTAELIENDYRAGKYFPYALTEDPEKINLLKPSYFITARPKFIRDEPAKGLAAYGW